MKVDHFEIFIAKETDCCELNFIEFQDSYHQKNVGIFKVNSFLT